MPARRPFFVFCVALLLPFLLGACGGARQISYTSAEDAFSKGVENYEDENYDRAIQYFRAVFSFGRANEWADDAQLYIARSYRDQNRYLLAGTEYSHFIEIYRNDERIAQVELERADAYYQLSPPFHLDQQDTRRALSYYQLFLDRHPQHELAPQAEERIEELQEKLAHKQYAAAELYERREMWEAAAQYYELVFDQYPQTRWADDALLGAVRSFVEYSERSVQARQRARYQRAIEHYNTMAQVFPDSPLLKEAEDWYERAARRVEQVEPVNSSL